MSTPVAMMEPHQGIPPHTCTCSSANCITEVGPQPKSKPSSFRKPRRSGIAVGSMLKRSSNRGTCSPEAFSGKAVIGLAERGASEGVVD